jgi:hypothetical protein
MYLLKGDQTLLPLIDKKTTALNFIIEIELLGWPKISADEINIIYDFIGYCYYYDYSQAIKNHTVELRKQYNLKLGDAFIAATALEFDLTLISADKSFAKVAGLNLINFVPSLK